MSNNPKQDHLQRRLAATIARTLGYGARNVHVVVMPALNGLLAGRDKPVFGLSLPHTINVLLWILDNPIVGFADLTGNHTDDLLTVTLMAERIEDKCFHLALRGLFKDMAGVAQEACKPTPSPPSPDSEKSCSPCPTEQAPKP